MSRVFQKIYIWEEFDETGHNIRVTLSHMHILDILQKTLEGPVVSIFVQNIVERLKIFYVIW